MRRSPGTVLSSAPLALTLALTGCGVGAEAPLRDGHAASGAASGSSGRSGTGSAGTATTTAETLFADGASHDVSIRGTRLTTPT